MLMARWQILSWGVLLIDVLAELLVAQPKSVSPQELIDRWQYQLAWREHAEWEVVAYFRSESTEASDDREFSQITFHWLTCGPNRMLVREYHHLLDRNRRNRWRQFFLNGRWLWVIDEPPAARRVTVEEDPQKARQAADHAFWWIERGNGLDGGAAGNQSANLPNSVRNADHLQVVRQERMGTWNTFVLEARMKLSDKTQETHLWLAPDLGCSVVKWSRRSIYDTNKDLVDLDDTEAAPTLPDGGALEEVYQEYEARNFRQFNGWYVALEGEYQKTALYTGGRIYREKIQFQRTRIEIGQPSTSDALKKISIPDGTPVIFLSRPLSGLRYEWRNGQIVPAYDPKIVEQIEQTTPLPTPSNPPLFP